MELSWAILYGEATIDQKGCNYQEYGRYDYLYNVCVEYADLYEYGDHTQQYTCKPEEEYFAILEDYLLDLSCQIIENLNALPEFVSMDNYEESIVKDYEDIMQ